MGAPFEIIIAEHLIKKADRLRSRALGERAFERRHILFRKYEMGIIFNMREFFTKQSRRIIPQVKQAYPRFVNSLPSPSQKSNRIWQYFIEKAGYESDFLFFVFGIIDWQGEERILSDLAEEEFKSVIQDSVMTTLMDVGSKIRFDFEKPGVRNIIQKHNIKFSKEVNETTRALISNRLAKGFADGESIKQIAEGLEEYLDYRAEWRSRLIAQTEIIGRSNEGSFLAMQMSERVEEKQWLNAGDDNVRDSHKIAGGQIRPIDKPFEVGGSYLMYPGDSSGPAKEVVGCRCTVIPYSYRRG